jgi:hypothetical protein
VVDQIHRRGIGRPWLEKQRQSTTKQSRRHGEGAQSAFKPAAFTTFAYFSISEPI